MTTLVALTIMLVPAAATRTAGASSPTERNYEQSFRYMRTLANRYHAQREDLQRRLTRRVLEVRALRWQLKKARHAVVHRPDSLEAIRLAANAYHVSFGKLYRRAMCETGGTLNPYSKNQHSSASGLFQFLYPSTWNSTPYAGESVWSPYANAMAAAWMEANGRGGEWVCRG